MRKQTVLGVVVSVVIIVVLIGLGIYLMVNLRTVENAMGKEESSRREGETSFVFETAGAEEDGQTARALAAAKDADKPLPEHHLIFVGDSRTVGMGEAEMEIGDGCAYVGAVGEGYSWFAETGLALMEEAMDESPDSPVVLNLGVNDPDMIEQYLELYRDFSRLYPDRSFYYMSVNPVTGEDLPVTNEEIAAFNQQLQEAFPDQYLDCSTYLNIHEFETVDGVHFTEDTYRLIHDFAVKEIFS